MGTGTLKEGPLEKAAAMESVDVRDAVLKQGRLRKKYPTSHSGHPPLPEGLLAEPGMWLVRVSLSGNRTGWRRVDNRFGG